MTEELEGLTCSELIKKLLDLFESQNEEEVDECLDWFLFTYSPEHSFALVQSNAEALKDPVLLEIIMTKVREIYEPEIFLETMNVISSIEGHEQEIAKSGAPRAVVTMMNRDIHNPRSQSLGCKVLANLSHDPEVCEWLGKIKAIVRIIEGLRRHQTSLDVAIECLRAMANLTYRCKANKDIMVSEHGIDVISDTMGLHKANVKLVNSALRALRNIVTLDSVLELQQHTLIHEVISCMNDHSAISEIQVHSIWILIGLMSGKAETKRHMTEQGSLEPILRAMEIHKSDSQVQLAGATALALLSKLSLHRTIIAKGAAMSSSSAASGSSSSSSSTNRVSGIRILLDALHNHRDVVPVQRAAIKALYRLSFTKAIREQLAEHSIVSEIVESMKVNSKVGPLQRVAIICLLQLAKTPQLREKVQHQAVSVMIQARNNFSNVPHLHSIAHVAVESMISNTPMVVTSGGAGTTIGVGAGGSVTADAHHLAAEQPARPHSPRGRPDDRTTTTIANTTPFSVSVNTTATAVNSSALESELNSLKNTLKDKEKQVETLQETCDSLEALLQQLKSQKESSQNSENTTPGSNTSSSSGSLITQLKQQAEALTNDLKKAKLTQDNLTSKLKEEQEKLTTLRNKKKQLAEEKTKDDSHPTISSDSNEKDEKAETKPKKGTTKTTKAKAKKDKSPRTSLTSSSSSVSEDDTNHDFDENASATTTTTSTTAITTTTSTASRGLKRNNPNRASLNAEHLQQLKQELEELSNKLAERDALLKDTNAEKEKFEQQLNKLNVELKGAHVLVQTLQKESLSQSAARDKVSAGSSMWSRYQKKTKELKDREAELLKENEELKKEQAKSSSSKKKRK